MCKPNTSYAFWGKAARACGAVAFAFACLASFPGASSFVSDAEARDLMRISADGGTKRVEVTRGKPVTFEIDEPIAEVLIGDEEIADISVISNTSFVVFGKTTGTSGIAIFDENRALVASLDIEVTQDLSRLSNTLRKRIPGSDIKVSSANGQIVLSGNVKDAVAAATASEIAAQYGETVINSLTITSSQQVMLEVRFIEADRSAEKELGIQWQALGQDVSAVVGTGLVSGSVPFGTLFGNIISTSDVQVDALIDALEESGVVRRLAEPNLTALSGDTASFLAGGEFPFPVPDSDDRITIEFKKFGVGLEFTPTVLDDGKVHLVIAPEVSEIDNSRAVTINGLQVPSLNVRRARTTVELRDGQSFVIAGLLQSINRTSFRAVPWIHEVPVLGALFRSTAFNRQESDLVIVVTPRLVAPLSPDLMAATGFDQLRQGNDADVFLGGRAEVPRGTQSTTFTTPDGAIVPVGHILPGFESRPAAAFPANPSTRSWGTGGDKRLSVARRGRSGGADDVWEAQ